MLSLKRLITNNWKYIAGGGTVLTYEAWLNSLKDRKLNAASQISQANANSTLTEMSKEIKELRVEISNMDQNAETKKELLSLADKLTELVEEAKMECNRYFQSVEKGNISETSEERYKMFKDFQETINARWEKTHEITAQIKEISEKKNFMEDGYIMETINSFKEYLSSLSYMELCLVLNITTSLFVLGCCMSIFLAYFGNFIIERLTRFTIMQKYPSLIKLIQIRVKFQRYYIYVNSIFILASIIFLIVINTITLLA